MKVLAPFFMMTLGVFLVGACWAFATTSSISDRIKILRNASTVDINLSPQALLDCGIEKGTGSCDGGSAINAFQFMQVYGITDDSCAPYMAVDYAFMSEYPCEETMCRTCDRLGNCRAIANATKYYVSEYGSVKGETNMMKEIWARGPIVCGIYGHSASFEDYRGGVITEKTHYTEITHDISLVGWGEENNLKYWIGRNSFGTQWGEYGWFRIERGTNCLLIESQCSWGIPKLSESNPLQAIKTERRRISRITIPSLDDY